MKNNKKLTIAAAALVALAAVGSVAFLTYAQGNETAPAAGQFRDKGARNRENLTEEQKTALDAMRAERQAQRETRQAEMNAAIAGGYEKFSAFIKEEQGENSPWREKINAENFAQFADAHALMTKAHSILTSLGLDESGFGPGRMGKGGAGAMGGMRGGCPMLNSQ